MVEVKQKKTSGVLQVLKCTLSSGGEITLLADEREILCCRWRPDSPWEASEPENLAIAAALNRWGRD